MQTLIEKLVAAVAKTTAPTDNDTLEGLTRRWRMLAALLELPQCKDWTPSVGTMLSAAARTCTLSLVSIAPSKPLDRSTPNLIPHTNGIGIQTTSCALPSTAHILVLGHPPICFEEVNARSSSPTHRAISPSRPPAFLQINVGHPCLHPLSMLQMREGTRLCRERRQVVSCHLRW